MLEIVGEGFPKGHGVLGLLSGDEFLEPVTVFDRKLIEASGPNVGLILCADHRAAPHSERFAQQHFATLGATTVTLDMHQDEPLPDFDLAYIGGGSPKGLLACLLGNLRWHEVASRWRGGTGLAGSSAGAMALCTHCLIPDEGASVPTRWSEGLGPVTSVGLAVHASSRPREWLHEVARAAPVPVVALDDATGLLLRDGADPEVEGPGKAWLL